MKMTRTFHPVGHGAFYTEKFVFDNNKEFNVVYDCGSKSPKKINDSIGKTFKEKDVINALFISHLHSDHINGLKKLFKWCHVSKLFMPVLTNLDVVLSLIRIDIEFKKQSKEQSEEWTKDDLNYINSFILWVYGNGDYDGDHNTGFSDTAKSMVENNSGYSGNEVYIKKGRGYDDLMPLYHRWKYIPYNPIRSDNEDYSNLVLALKELDLYDEDEIDINKLIDAMKDDSNREKIIEAYGEVGDKKHNCYSMTLFSGPRNQTDCDILDCDYNNKRLPHCRDYDCKCCICNQYRYLANCIYLGDIDLKRPSAWDDFYDTYRHVYDSVGVVQIPHHGSIHNYNIEINKRHGKLSILSVPNEDKHHPSREVLSDIMASGGIPVCVNGNDYSKVELTYYTNSRRARRVRRIYEL